MSRPIRLARTLALPYHAFHPWPYNWENLSPPSCVPAQDLLHYRQHTLVSLWVSAYAQISGVFLFYEYHLYKIGLVMPEWPLTVRLTAVRRREYNILQNLCNLFAVP